MGIYQKIRELWKKPRKNMPELMKARLIKWRKEQTTVRLERPTRIDRARSLGYKAKQGVIVVRQKVMRNEPMRPKLRGGRRSKHGGLKKTLSISQKTIAEQRANKKFPNMEVLNSYWVGQDPKNLWFEVILINPSHPAIMKDKELSKILKQKGRVKRGLTSSARKSRGLRKKGTGSEKTRKK